MVSLCRCIDTDGMLLTKDRGCSPPLGVFADDANRNAPGTDSESHHLCVCICHINALPAQCSIIAIELSAEAVPNSARAQLAEAFPDDLFRPPLAS